MQFIFSHGWGFDHQFWQPLLPFFNSYPCINLDHGYFSEKQLSNQPYLGNNWIGIGHSLGFIKLLELNINFKALIGLQTFINFLGYDPALKKIRLRNFSLLEKHFLNNPIKTLDEFYQSCGWIQPLNLAKDLNIDRLTDDLHLLKKDFINMLPLCPLFLLSSKDDAIVTPALVADNQKHLNSSVSFLEEYPEGKHILGYSRPAEIHKRVMEFLNAC